MLKTFTKMRGVNFWKIQTNFHACKLSLIDLKFTSSNHTWYSLTHLQQVYFWLSLSLLLSINHTWIQIKGYSLNVNWVALMSCFISVLLIFLKIFLVFFYFLWDYKLTITLYKKVFTLHVERKFKILERGKKRNYFEIFIISDTL